MVEPDSKDDIRARMERCIDSRDFFEDLQFDIVKASPNPIPIKTQERINHLTDRMNLESKNLQDLTRKLNER